MPKYKTNEYTEYEIKECQKGVPKQNCTDCACTVEECMECLKDIREEIKDKTQ